MAELTSPEDCPLTPAHHCVDGHLERVCAALEAFAKREQKANDWGGNFFMELAEVLRYRFTPKRARNVEMAGYFSRMEPSLILAILERANLIGCDP